MKGKGYPDGDARIIVALPAISYCDAEALPRISLFSPPPVKFKPLGCTLDVFASEIQSGIPGLWALNIPHLPLRKTSTVGVAGPGLPAAELFNPQDMANEFEALVGSYDKWRPYPAEPPLSQYERKMAKRCAKKRCRIFRHAALNHDWEVLFYVEHAACSLRHLDREAAMEVSEIVIEELAKLLQEMPGIPVLLFSPYGAGSDSGFVEFNREDGSMFANWHGVRKYLDGSWKLGGDGHHWDGSQQLS